MKILIGDYKIKYPIVYDKPNIPGVEIFIDKEISVEMSDDVVIQLIEILIKKLEPRRIIQINTQPYNLREVIEKIYK